MFPTEVHVFYKHTSKEHQLKLFTNQLSGLSNQHTCNLDRESCIHL